ncbi:MAG: ABC transporter ATP-binding protein [Lachnospiraceae bacterium]|nr:ABC transporter ATP-binding protein [Lachnospiraceae bacterium]
MAEYAVETKDLTKQFGRIVALDKVNLHLTRGTVYGLVGKNGSGKSTLIRVLAGLSKPTSGGYVLFGREDSQKGFSSERKLIGVAAEGAALVPGETLETNLKRQCSLLGIPGKNRPAEVMKLTGLTEFARTKAAKLPEEKPVLAAIAMALCGNPDLLLLDGPFEGLGAQQRASVAALLASLNRELELSILVTASDPESLFGLATRYGILTHGDLVRELSSEEMKAAQETALRVKVSDVNALARVLVAKDIRHRILDADTADIYGKPQITELVMALAKEGCDVLELEERTERAENLLDALGGGKV